MTFCSKAPRVVVIQGFSHVNIGVSLYLGRCPKNKRDFYGNIFAFDA
jgi:hypothetical protein